uniref:Uncharacterized protein n=1 Tax=Oryza barthii TaxID=65489 RepID=A0A0D3HV57_9ORYZ
MEVGGTAGVNVDGSLVAGSGSRFHGRCTSRQGGRSSGEVLPHGIDEGGREAQYNVSMEM